MPDKVAWLHTLGCALTGRLPVEVHHERRRGEPADDRKTVPLLPELHREGPASRHVLGREAFNARHGVDIEALCAEYQARWEAREAA